VRVHFLLKSELNQFNDWFRTSKLRVTKPVQFAFVAKTEYYLVCHFQF